MRTTVLYWVLIGLVVLWLATIAAFRWFTPVQEEDVGAVFFAQTSPLMPSVDSKFDIVSVYDGDTITVTIPDWPPIVGQRMPVRLYGIDAPEIHGSGPEEHKMAEKARLFLQKKISHASDLELLNVRRDKYFRLLAELYVDHKNVSELMLSQKLVKPYQGGTKEPWVTE